MIESEIRWKTFLVSYSLISLHNSQTSILSLWKAKNELIQKGYSIQTMKNVILSLCNGKVCIRHMNSKHICKFWTSCYTKKCKLKANLRCHLIQISIIFLKETSDTRCWWEIGEKGKTMHGWFKLLHVPWKSVWKWFQKEKKIMWPTYNTPVQAAQVSLLER